MLLQKNVRLFIMGVICALIIAGCKDSGNGPSAPQGQAAAPSVAQVAPNTASVGDTVTITGTRFGSVQGANTVSIGGTIAQTIISWSDTLIRARVPNGATSGNVFVIAGTSSSNAVAIVISGTTPPPQVSFSATVRPIFNAHGCIGCHGGNGGLNVGTVSELLTGGNHGPAVIPGNADGSNLVQKLSSSPPFGARMPQGGPYLDNATIQTIKDWINQGAANN